MTDNSSTSLDRYFTLSIRESATFDSISAIFKFSTYFTASSLSSLLYSLNSYSLSISFVKLFNWVTISVALASSLLYSVSALVFESCKAKSCLWYSIWVCAGILTTSVCLSEEISSILPVRSVLSYPIS